MLFEREGLDKLEKIQNAPQSIKTVAHLIKLYLMKLSQCF